MYCAVNVQEFSVDPGVNDCAVNVQEFSVEPGVNDCAVNGVLCCERAGVQCTVL